MRHVEHLPIAADSSVHVAFERLQHELGFLHLLLGREEAGIDDRHLIGVDRELAGETGPAGLCTRGLKPLLVTKGNSPGLSAGSNHP